MNKQFEGKVAFISGGTSGLGKATVYELVKRGARVIFVGRDDARLRKLSTNAKNWAARLNIRTAILQSIKM